MQVSAWIHAFRLRTLPLSLSCVGMGAFLAARSGAFQWDIFGLCMLTTLFLQVLSNLANDYGDSVHGADSAHRSGPVRTVQSGAISVAKMRSALAVLTGLCLLSGITLLLVAFGWNTNSLLAFLILGLLCIAAAITYTVGRRPYGYAGLGDVAVLIFFGIVGVGGSNYLYTQEWRLLYLLPALSCGFFSMAVLNINNIRDIESDRIAAKRSIPVRIGKRNAAIYHWFLISGGWVAAIAFSLIWYHAPWQFLYVLTLPLFVRNGWAVQKNPSARLDPWLRQMAVSTLLFVLLFGIGLMMAASPDGPPPPSAKGLKGPLQHAP